VTSTVSIVNNALNIIGASNITELEENSKTARVMNQMYESIRDDVFRAHPWNCLIRRANLAQSVDTPAFDYAYQYALPTDPYCLRVLEFQNGSMTYPYENLIGQGNKPFFVIEGRNILTDSGTARIKYIARITDPTQYDAGLISVLAARLASEAAYAITGSTSVVQFADALYERKLREARFSDATENATVRLEASDFIEARF
jgi:hypothetical protein